MFFSRDPSIMPTLIDSIYAVFSGLFYVYGGVEPIMTGCVVGVSS